MTREEIENLVVEATRRSDKTTLIRSAINIAVQEVSSARFWSDLMTEDEVSISANSPSVDLASDVARVTEARVLDGTQSRPLEVVPKTWLIERVPDPSSRSAARPSYGYLQGQTLFVVPYPDTEYDIAYTYYRLHPELSASSDEILIRHASPAVTAYAVYWTFKSIEKHEDAAQWLATYGQHLASAIKVDKANTVTKFKASEHRDPARFPGEYWLDPFVKRMP